MGLKFDNHFVATGLARCKCCGKVIAKGELCIRASGFRTSGFCHKDCNHSGNVLSCPNCGIALESVDRVRFKGGLYDRYKCPDCAMITVLDLYYN